MKESGRSGNFGRRIEPHTVIIARGDDIHHFQVRPWVAALAGSVLAALAICYLLATSYLVLRDDLIDASTARQARLQQAYEDRISALRTQVDRITSRQLLDQQLVEAKVGELLERQSQLTKRHGLIEPVLGRVSDASTLPPEGLSPPESKTDLRASLMPEALRQTIEADASSMNVSLWPSGTSGSHDSAADRADRLFATINQSLRSIEAQQLSRITSIAENAYETADAISTALKDAGLKFDDQSGSGMGGPLIAVDSPSLFDTKVRELDDALDQLDRIKTQARQLPLANPSPGHGISSTFGVRTDPLLGTPAMHSGMDFRAPSGSDVYATAAGTVVRAGWRGGYGRMVEIRHEGGFTTCYAHLSRILVNEGQKLLPGDVVGKVGSSGRSTGPHLHYEVHRDGKALNPVRFIKAGKKVSQYL